MKKEIGIVIIATNAYFILGIRFIRKFNYYYKGDKNVKFYFFSDTDPKDYLSENIKIEYHHAEHKTWRDGTNSKFRNIVSLKDCSSDWIFYFDADTDIDKDFTEEWMIIGDMVGGEHYGNRNFLSDGKGMDRNPDSNAYIPYESKLPYTYYYGAFFGGLKERMIGMCELLMVNQWEDQQRGYEAPVNDESYINCYFHFHAPATVKTEQFAFLISDKGGLGETRKTNLDIEKFKNEAIKNKQDVFELKNNQLIWK
jgi:hypothetical protein